MEYYNNILCATCKDLSDIVNYEALNTMVARGKAKRVRRGCKNTPALYAVDSLPLKYKTEVYRRFPDMKTQAESKQFVDEIKPDDEAFCFYARCLFDNGKQLPYDKVREYANNAAVLNAFRAVLERPDDRRRRPILKERINKTEFWSKAARALSVIAYTLPHSLPRNPRRLQEKYNQYQDRGYIALVSGKYGMKNAAKK